MRSSPLLVRMLVTLVLMIVFGSLLLTTPHYRTLIAGVNIYLLTPINIFGDVGEGVQNQTLI